MALNGGVCPFPLAWMAPKFKNCSILSVLIFLHNKIQRTFFLFLQKTFRWCGVSFLGDLERFFSCRCIYGPLFGHLPLVFRAVIWHRHISPVPICNLPDVRRRNETANNFGRDNNRQLLDLTFLKPRQQRNIWQVITFRIVRRRRKKPRPFFHLRTENKWTAAAAVSSSLAISPVQQQHKKVCSSSSRSRDRGGVPRIMHVSWRYCKYHWRALYVQY